MKGFGVWPDRTAGAQGRGECGQRNNAGAIKQPKMRENPAISDWIQISEGLTEGLLGGRLAQRQAALRGVWAAGARRKLYFGLPCMPEGLRAPPVPQKKIFLETTGY